MNKLFSALLLLTLLFSFTACTYSETEYYCDNCSETIHLTSNERYTYCPNCGIEIPENNNGSSVSTLTDEKKLLGTWIYVDSSWGNFAYTFYSDGSCKGLYYGNVYNVYPSLIPILSSKGSGQGYWSFVDNKLKIDYQGKDKGIIYYDFLFSEDNSQLSVDTTTVDEHSVKWLKYPENSNIDAYAGYLEISFKDAYNNKKAVAGYSFIREAEIRLEDGVYWVAVEFTELGLERFNDFRSTYSEDFKYEIWVEDVCLIKLNSKKGLWESQGMSFPCDSYEQAVMIAYRLNQAL